MRVACIGECMVELREEPDGRMARGFGGDTLNTAVYLARLGVAVDYVTALGDDPWSEEMVAAWTGEGIGTDRVLRCAGKMPGLYVIQTDASGERRFLYWRDSAAARQIFTLPETDGLVSALMDYQLLYYSGISLSLYGVDGRARLMETVRGARRRGAIIAFDTNFRPRGWPDRTIAQQSFRAAMAEADVIFASVEDLEMLFGPGWEQELSGIGVDCEVVLKLREPACSIRQSGKAPITVSAAPVTAIIDTTAAGDSFAAAYLCAKLRGLSPEVSAARGHQLAGTVIRYPGAIIPKDAMPTAATEHRSMSGNLSQS
jgi:2-dehydro-3-deoxygluconokinase